jgi:hypothetical protein
MNTGLPTFRTKLLPPSSEYNNEDGDSRFFHNLVDTRICKTFTPSFPTSQKIFNRHQY